MAEVLPFSTESNTVDVSARAMGLQVFPAPLHKLMLECDLVKGEVRMGVPCMAD